MSQKLHRRTLLQCIAAVAASTAFGCSKDEEVPTSTSLEHFPQSVASGDPRSDSVVLWTRAVDPKQPDAATRLSLQVGTDPELRSLVLELDGLQALPAHDHTLKVKVANLQPRTTYYYRFTQELDGQRYTSPVGRTRTAPAQGQDVPVRFVFASCQDFIGRYYNTWQYLLRRDEDLDFVMFLGDYIYETIGDTSFQTPDESRTVRFSDPASALRRGASGQNLAAASVSNYRDLYRTLHSDPILRQVHERYPFIIVWDDHEFSNDSWGSHATYSNGRADEHSDERKRNAEQAFHEYLPLDTTGSGAGAIDVDSVPRYPDTRIYRDFDYGKNLKLLVTDTRTYRPDHLIPEDAYPGTVVMDAAALTATGAAAALSSDLYAYVDIDAAEYASQKQALQQAYQQLALQAGLGGESAAKAVQHVRGNLALAYVNQILTRLGATPISPTGKPRGLAYVHLGKTDLFNELGARYVVVKQTYDLYSAYRYAVTQRASENVLGDTQEAWLRETVRAADNTWKVVVSSVSLTSMVWDLSDLADAPANLRTRFYFNADQWDGFPNKRAELLKYLRDNNVRNALFISGDIHSSFASVEQGVPTLTTPSISSTAVKEMAAGAVVAAGYPATSSIFRRVVTDMDATLRASNPGIAFSHTDAHGFVVLEVRADEALATFHLVPSAEVKTNHAAQPEALAGKFSRKDLRIRDGVITDA